MINTAKTKPELNKFGNPVNAPIAQGDPTKPIVGWQWGAKQRVTTFNIKASRGYFSKIFVSEGTISQGTYNQSLFQNGTISNTGITGGTENMSIFNTGTVNTSLIASGTFNTGTIGTSLFLGGTVNATVYENGGTATSSGSIVYVKSVNFAGSTVTLGTVSFQQGLIIAFS